jgi:biotin carboxyl carrier protein
MKINRALFLFAFLIIGLTGCKPKATTEQDVKASAATTAVTITHITMGAMSDSITLSATSLFQKKNSLKSSATGYVTQVNVKVGDYVQAGQVLFTVQTKEASAYTSKALDTLFHFNGTFAIRASSAGIVTQVDKLSGDYVADGDQLCLLAQRGSLVLILNVPYELNQFVRVHDACVIELPDHTTISGMIDSRLSTVDAVSQTQSFIVKPAADKNLPENLITRIRILKTVKQNTRLLPKEAVLTDETEENFWVMKLINDTTAVRVPVVKGIETRNQVEIISPPLTAVDRIILTGSYGLPDTASVKIEAPKGNE